MSELSEAGWVSLEGLAALPPWPRERELALPGRVRGTLLRDWGPHVTRRMGADALVRLRSDLGIDERALPDSPRAGDWYPVGLQSAITRWFVDEALGGDLLAFEPLLAEDTGRAQDKLLALAMRTLGPRRIMRWTGKLHAYFYDGGAAEAEVGNGSASLRFRGAAFLGDPTWRVLQAFATRGLLLAFKREIVSLAADISGDDRFALAVKWR